MAKTTFSRNGVLNALLRNTALQGAATVYLALHSADPGAAGSANELAGNGYARAAIAFGDAAADGAIENTAAVTFPEPTGAWTTATHFSIKSAASAGDTYYAGALAAPVTGQTGVPISFPVGAIDITES